MGSNGMDFLDPKKRMAHKRRLIVGYILVGIAIALGALILVYGAAGYGINTKNGDIVQNGLLFLDSKPGGASIYLNDKPQNTTTSARLVLPAGSYKLSLKKTGYREWQRSFTLNEHTIARFVYPFLFPAKPTSKVIKIYPSLPSFVTMSPDHRWLIVQAPSSSPDKVSFDEYDTANLTQPPKEISLSAPVVTDPAAAGNFMKEVEWSSDNKHLLLNHSYQGGNEFIIFNRDNPLESANINKLFKLNPSQVSLKNKKIDQLYLFTASDSSLAVGDSALATVSPLLKHVLAFKAYGNNLINYVSDQDLPAGQVSARIWDTDKSYPLYAFAAGSVYLVNVAQYQGHFYYIAGSDRSERINLYKDPLSSIKNPSVGKAIPLLSLHALGASEASFSTNSRFIAVQAGQTFALYDFETQSSYHYTFNQKLDGSLHWMDGHLFIGSSGGTIFVSDYDGTNRQQLLPTMLPSGGFFDKDYNHLLTMAASEDKVVLQSIDMRAGQDLPKQ